MICDSMRAFHRYAALAPEVWKKLADFFATLTEDTAAGSYELDGPELRVNLVDAKLAPVDTGKYEAHRQFIDIHIPLDGEESILCRPDSCDLKQLGSYSEENDCVFYETAAGINFALDVGYFLLIYPGEPHQPQIGKAGSIRKKLIVKIDKNLMK